MRQFLSVVLGGMGVALAMPQVPGSFANPDFPRPPGAKDGTCYFPECTKPQAQFERISPVTARLQWLDAGGYCGSLSVQSVTLAKGAWISQQQVRDHTSPGGGHDNEILDTNIEEALDNLKIKYDAFDYKNLPQPQADAYRTWLKRQLAAGHPVVWMILLYGGHFPVYPGMKYGWYSHVEPVFGLLSNRSLDDPTWYPDDVLVHATDVDDNVYYRTFDSLPDNLNFTGACFNNHDTGRTYACFPCIYDQMGFGWAVTDLADTRAGALPMSLDVGNDREPDVRDFMPPAMFHGTLLATNLTSGVGYSIFRWDSSDAAFDYTRTTSVHNFTATTDTFSYKDPKYFWSNSTVYYRCHPQ